MPVLAVGGEKFFGNNEAVVIRYAATQVTDIVVPEAGHWLMEEALNVTVKAVQELLDGR